MHSPGRTVLRFIDSCQVFFPGCALPILVGTLSLLVTGEGALAETSKAELPTDSAEVRLYVPNQRGESISVLDGEGALLSTVDLSEHGFSDHAMPHQVVVAPNGSWYVTLAGEGAIAKFDGNNQLVAKTTFEAPGMIALDHRRGRVYVSRALSAVSPPTSLGVFRMTDLEQIDEVDIFVSRPHALAVDSITGRVYSASLDGNRIAAVDPVAEKVEVTNVDGMSGGFVGLDTSPDGEQLVATTEQTNELLAFDADSLALDQVASLSVASGPYDVRYSPDGESVWFPNQDANAVTRIDPGTWNVATVVEHGSFEQPHGVAFAPDSRTVYISSHGMSRLKASPSNGSLTLIDAAAGSVRRVTEVGPYAAAIGLGEQ
jgi:DNA-binding beta-propeller fold protein YncE